MARPKARRIRKGFSILELVVVLVVVGILVLLIAPSFKTYREREQVREAAERLAADLDGARQAAKTRGLPTGVIIRSPQSYEIRQGSGANTRLLKFVDLSQEYPQARIFVGWWDTDSGHPTTVQETQPPVNDIAMSGWSGSSQDATTSTPGQTPPEDNDLAMSGWSGSSQDAAYVYWPNGYVRTNNMPRYDNSYHVVVAAGFQSTPAGPPTAGGMVPAGDEVAVEPPQQYRKLVKLWTPAYTVTLPVSGKPALETLPPIMRSVQVDPPGPRIHDALSPVPAASRPAGDTPAFTETPIVPVDVKGATVAAGQRVQLKASLQPIRDRLHYQWTAAQGVLDGNGTPAVTWQVPRAPGTYAVELTVTTDKGRKVAQLLQLTVERREAVVFSAVDSRRGRQIFRVEPNGSNLTCLTRFRAGASSPVWSPDGTMIAFHGVPYAGGKSAIYVMNADGTGLRRISPSVTPWSEYNHFAPAWSPDGTRLAWEMCPSVDQADIVVANASQSGQLAPVTSTASIYEYGPTWSPNGRKIFYHADLPSGDSEIRGYSVFTRNPADAFGPLSDPLPSDASVTHLRPSYFPGDKIVWACQRDGVRANGAGIYLMNEDGSGRRQIVPAAGEIVNNPSWGPLPVGGGAKRPLIFLTNRGITIVRDIDSPRKELVDLPDSLTQLQMGGYAWTVVPPEPQVVNPRQPLR